MKEETQIAEEIVQSETTPPSDKPRIDINSATEKELTSLPGIGTVMATRIMAYREEHGPFLLPEEVTAVSGIAKDSYERFADQIDTQLPAELPTSAAQEEVEEPPVPDEPEPATESESPMEVEPFLEPETATEEEPTEELEVAAEDEQPEEIPAAAEPPAAPEPEVKVETESKMSTPPPAAAPRERAALNWIWTALLGGFLGMIFALLVLAGINGSLDINHSQALIAVRADMENLSAEMESLQGDISGIRQRLDSLESLTSRMEENEENIQELESRASDLEAAAAGLRRTTKDLETELASLHGNFEELEKGVSQSHTFFLGMRELITNIFGEGGGEESGLQPSEELSPVATPSE